ncbi:MAG TPA: hypothetical protein VK864_11870, partial [Longimicrobiales bacterium]|nr:hypothetical protein [Longimicrobiales bacterium]
EMLNPINHARTPAEVAVYQAEPYVIAADVYGVAPHIGRAGWTWYTGSAGWMFRVGLESILGFELLPNEVRLRPCVPAAWPGFRLRYRFADGTLYRFEVEQHNRTPTRATLDGADLSINDGAVIVPIVRDAAEHSVHVRLGADVGPRYRSLVSE